MMHQMHSTSVVVYVSDFTFRMFVALRWNEEMITWTFLALGESVEVVLLEFFNCEI